MECAERFPEEVHTENKPTPTNVMEDKHKLSFDQMFEKYSKMLFWLAYDRLQNAETAKDIVQEAFFRYDKELRIQKHSSLYNDNHAKAWLLRTTGNLCTDILRKQEIHLKYEKELLDIDKYHGSIDTIENLFAAREGQERIDKVFCKLLEKNPKWYLLITENYYNHKTAKELAEKVGMTPAAMGMLLIRIRKWIGKELLKQNRDLRRVYDKVFEKEKDNNGKK